MIRHYVLPVVAVAGLVLAIVTVRGSSQPAPATQPIARPAQTSFASYVAGAGLVEASTENIAIGTFVPGVVADVWVEVGQRVKAGEPLFTIDDRELRAQLAVEEASIASARAEASNRERELKRLERVGQAASADERDKAFWQAEIARAQLTQAEARRQALQVDLERRLVRAPVDGTVLQVKTRKGEYASAGPLSTPLMLLGDVDTLHVRIDVDENDAWRVRPDAKANASVRGNRDLKADLRFVRIEPYIVPKRSLTGESNERVDTRVLQVIYAFDAETFEENNGTRVYPGQQMDVFIEASALKS